MSRGFLKDITGTTTPEKAMSTERTEQSAIINFCVDFGETSIETKQMMEEL